MLKYVIAASLMGTAAMAQGVLTYDVFEHAIDHADLTDCPADLAGDDRFCRATLHNEDLNVFVFSLDGDQPLIAVKSYPLEDVTRFAG
ncbi:hypothetical protein [Paracoccus sp. (in: a-proteobacteria)]|uniref:hypothetical protein n=1 Tax=Paracoccus sp. TaxID=267 RepID=UPI0026DED340|nr:hypothetical protein [Paracoccus sp. (in: a-proteobacteria)]MDO5646563.1 hypothetical protein [Paracoccus sp. (in: a-proteobacteria)]